ncbi:MAG: SdrD B-like domain-containing protein [bacterium]|nr:SdrD B-like domain-containing protein [bacterium]
MKKISVFALLAVAIMALVMGCSNDSPIVTDSQASAVSNQLMGIPSNATITSALLWVHTPTLDTHTVQIHKVTAPWDEATVTWNSFGGASEATMLASSLFDNIGYFSFDLSSYAPEFLDGVPDYGFLLRLPVEELRPEFVSGRESVTNGAYLEICYTTPDTSNCMTFDVAADAPISSAMPDVMYGGMPLMTLGPLGTVDTTSEVLLAFDVPVVQQVASVGDFVWMDENMDGIQDSSEVGLAGIMINLTGCTEDTLVDPLTLTTTTDTNGYYKFDSLLAGEYFVQFFVPAGYLFSPQQATDINSDSDPDPTTGSTACFELLDGMVITSIDAGMYYEIVDSGCTYSKGYWKNHAGFGPQDDMLSQHLPQSLGSVDVTDAQVAVDYLSQKVYGAPKNGITKLYAQLLAAKLNIANGASSSDVDDVISDADSFLDANDWTAWDSLDKENQKDVLGWKDMLDDYNNGIIGPGHCGDDENEEEGGEQQPSPAGTLN